MFRRLVRRLSGSSFARVFSENVKPQNKSPPLGVKCIKPAALLISAALCKPSKKEELLDYEIDIGTWSESEGTVVNLMNVLKESIIGASIEYRNCLNKQIEITQASAMLGTFNDKWDDLPEYRVLADELKQEVEKYLTLIKTLGQIASDETFASILPNPEDGLRIISQKYKELEEILQKELEENRRIEMKLLQVKRDSILSMTQ